VVGRH